MDNNYGNYNSNNPENSGSYTDPNSFNNQNNYNNPNNSYNYNNGPYAQPPQSPKKGCGFGIAALVIGILSMTLCCIGGTLLGVLGIIFGIVALCRKESNFGLAIGGIVTSVFGLLIGIYMLFAMGISMTLYDQIKDMNQDELKDWMQNYLKQIEEGDISAALGMDAGEDPFSEHSFVLGDDSAIYFYDDGSFLWYQDDSDHDDNFYSGTYESYMGERAQTYLTEDLADYGVTEQELEEYYSLNADSDFYKQENLCCLVIHKDVLFSDGATQDYEPKTNYYMGYYADGYYDAANMDSAEYISFTLLK